MKPRHLILLLICSSLLAACYRQAEEPFQQIDSAEVVTEAPLAVAATAVEGRPAATSDAATIDIIDIDEGQATPAGQFITPETAPGQVDLPTLAPLNEETATATVTLPSYERPTATQTFEEQLDPDDECVYQVQAGNVLFRLALAWGTTYETIMELNQLESENLSIGQLLLMPDCRPSSPAGSESEAALTPGAIELATEGPTPEPTATPRPQYHVVSAGETIESISLRYRVDVNELIALNELANPNQLSVGQELTLPAG